MTLATVSILVLGAIIGFVVAWHWQRIKYERLLRRIIGNKQ